MGQGCTNNVAGGQGLTEFPPEAGVRFGGILGTQYAVLQIHYDNPSLIPGIFDESALSMHYTSKLRKYDAGAFLVNTNWDDAVLPPGKVLTISGTCDLDKMPHPINIIGIGLHMHYRGAQTWLARRDATGVFKENIDMNLYWDFNKGPLVSLLNTPIVVNPGEQLETSCLWNTKQDTSPIHGGLSSNDEMCITWLLYYPVIDDPNFWLCQTSGDDDPYEVNGTYPYPWADQLHPHVGPSVPSSTIDFIQKAFTGARNNTCDGVPTQQFTLRPDGKCNPLGNTAQDPYYRIVCDASGNVDGQTLCDANCLSCKADLRALQPNTCATRPWGVNGTDIAVWFEGKCL